ncbi:hypothetical protein SASPL_150790 [Salvia splendens]|uniref:Solute carrier family 25 (Mitochondrial phosphate transporter), member 23/24/25/41 n=1 Tax=Salvia splendens TaxID=180675 RepID=A0A8X8Z223_SALSN|nr:hypothetical protein SASPL_150790 [Salvia splendens]
MVMGGIAGAVSRTAVAPLETIRTHLMVGSSGNSSSELFVYDTVNKNVSQKQLGEQPKLRVPPSLVAGACAGVSSTLITYPLELVKTRLTIQSGAYNGLLDAFLKILEEGGLPELYRGLTPSLIGEKIGNIETLLIGSAAGAISSSTTFPLEVARKHMQVGAVSRRHVYKNVLHALASILEREGLEGLYRGLGPSCLKLGPAAGISFMCYEACKRILIDIEEDEE